MKNINLMFKFDGKFLKFDFLNRSLKFFKILFLRSFGLQ